MAHSHKLGTLALVGLCVVATACSRSSRRHHGGGGGGANVFSFVEAEPNNLELDANYLGTLAIGETLIVRGFIEDTVFDPFDGFAITALEPMDVEFYLTADDPFADLDLCYFNPYSGLNEACWETSFNPEAGLLAMGPGEDFHLVVASYFGASTYTLEIRGFPLGFAPAAAPAPAAEAERRERATPFEAYGGGAVEAEVEAAAEAEPSVRGRVILFDPETERVATAEFEAP